MKRFIFFAFLLCPLFFFIDANAQPNSYYGLRIGQKYSSEQVVEAVGDNGIHRWQLDGETRTLKKHVFSNVTYEGRHYSSLQVLTLLSDSTFVGIRLSLVDESTDGSFDLDSVFTELKDTLSSQYKMKPTTTSNENITGLEYRNPFGPSIILDKTQSKERTTEISLMYVSTAEIEVDLIMNGPGYKPTIQDTFSKLKLGKKYLASTIKSAFKRNGTFLSESQKTDGKLIVFCDFRFADHLWDYAEIQLTRKGIFSSFRVYDGYSTIANEEVNAAHRLYEGIKRQLNTKYDPNNVLTEIESMKLFSGDNGIDALLHIYSGKTRGGNHRIFVELVYSLSSQDTRFEESVSSDL